MQLSLNAFSPADSHTLCSSSSSSSEAELAPKREVPPGEATALEALLRGDSLLEKKTNICKEEETLLEIQVFYHVCSMYIINVYISRPWTMDHGLPPS